MKWSQIMGAHIGAENWTYLQGNIQEIACKYSVESFRDCVKVFAHGAREQQKYYTSHLTGNPRKIPIRSFADQLEKLNSYIPILPGVIDSPQGADKKRAVALDEAELAQFLLRLVPQAQQDQYQLIKGMIPENLRATLDTLETIEKMDIQVPRKTEKLVEKSGKRKGTSEISLEEDVYRVRETFLQILCPLCKAWQSQNNSQYWGL